MSRQPVTVGGRSDATEIRNELLNRLGLAASANDQDVESAHDELVEFLDRAPHEVKSWAAARTTDVDEAFALLSGPEQDLLAETQITAMAQPGPVETSQPPTAPPAAPLAPVTPGRRKPGRTQMVWAIVPILVVAVVLAVFYMGRGSSVPGISGTPTAAATTATGQPTAVPVDPAKVAALTKKITANPKDTVSLQSLGDIYFAAQDYKNAIVWEQKVLAVDPKNQVALLALGAGQFNNGNSAQAKKQWLVAAALYPKTAEVHYDLGFLYMSQTPPDTANMNAEWKKVIAIDPNSTLAQTVSSHMSTATATPSAK